MAKQTRGETFSFADEPAPAKTVIDQPQVLLDWLIRFWTKPSITARDLHRLGPSPIRNKRMIASSTQVLVDRGWLIPAQTWRRDMRKWNIARGLPLS